MKIENFYRGVEEKQGVKGRQYRIGTRKNIRIPLPYDVNMK